MDLLGSPTAIAKSVPRAMLAMLIAGAIAGAPAHAATYAAITPSLHPDRLGARGALTFTIQYAGGELGVPSPVLQSTLRFPAGLGLNIPSLRSCDARRLRISGPNGCAAQSRIGSGHALVEARAGAELIREQVSLWAFLGPPTESLEPTFEILGQGYTPLDERSVLTGKVLPDRAPYGEDLMMPIPAFPTLALEPDASIVTFSLTIGSSASRPRHNATTVVVPSRCPSGGFPFAAEFSYADGSSSTVQATSPCPR